MERTIVGIDPSLTGTAVVIGQRGDGGTVARMGTENIGDSVGQRIVRCTDLVNRVEQFIASNNLDDAPLVVFIEGYSFGSNDARAKFSAEYGGLLRAMLSQHTTDIYEVAPATLKKFATGKGTGAKDMIGAHLAKRYGVLFDTNDEFDAYALYRLGLVATGVDKAPTKPQQEAVDAVMNPKPKKSKPRRSNQE